MLYKETSVYLFYFLCRDGLYPLTIMERRQSHANIQRPLTPEEGETEENSNPPPDDVETRLVSSVIICVDRGVGACKKRVLTTVVMVKGRNDVVTSSAGFKYELQDEGL
jgi:hypothetical protein